MALQCYLVIVSTSVVFLCSHEKETKSIWKSDDEANQLPYNLLLNVRIPMCRQQIEPAWMTLYGTSE